jgi:Family of unknown function (DUF6498)
MLNKFKWLMFLPVSVSNLYSMYGVLFLNWSVADIFFWFWCEFVLAGITAFVLMMIWVPAEKKANKVIARLAPMMPYAFGFSFLYMLFFASLFAGVAYKGEWESWNRFPQFFADKTTGLLATVPSYAIILVMALVKRDQGDSQRLALQFNRKMFVVLGFYVLYLIHGWIREWSTGAQSLNLSPEYLKGMGLTLLALKLLAECGLFDRFAKRKPKQKSGT